MEDNLHKSDENKRKWKKKPKNFLSNAKKYAKKGQMGRGTKIPEETYQYFVGILEVMKKGVDTEEEKHSLVNNVLEKTVGTELDIVGNQLGCRVIELLLPYSSPEDLERLMDALFPELRRLCSCNFSSHVIETILRVSCERATENLQITDESIIEENNEIKTDEEPPKKKKKKSANKEQKYTAEHVQKCMEYTLKLSKYALNNLEDFVWDNYANHILRSALKCLSGITLLPGEKPKPNIFKDNTKTKQNSKGIPPHRTEISYKEVPEEFKDLVKEFAVRLSSWPQFKDLPYKNITSALLQVLLFATKNVDKHLTRNLLKRLLDESFAPDDWTNSVDDYKDDKKITTDEATEVNGETTNNTSGFDEKTADSTKYFPKSSLPPVFSSEAGVRCLEAALFVAKKKTYTQIYAKCFINRLGMLVTMPMLNFTVQRLFDNCHEKEEFEPMFEELSDKFSNILRSGNTGVLVAMAKACHRIKAKQTQFIQNMEKALKCESDDRMLILSLLQLLPADRVDVTKLCKEYFIHIHGSIILQTLLNFQRPTKIVKGLLDLSPEELLVILTDAKGCHVADAMFQGEFVGVKSRDKMLWKLKGLYQKLALSQYGSRAFDVIFEASSIEQKIKIMTEISEKSNLLKSTMYGDLMSNKLNIELFKKSQDNWVKFAEKLAKKNVYT